MLTFVGGPNRGEHIPVEKGTKLSLGRSSSAGRKIRDSHLSRLHFEIDFTGQRAIVRDLESRNGVFVNGRKVNNKLLGPNDRLLAGEQTFDVRYADSLEDLVFEEAEETLSFNEERYQCLLCERAISLATFAEGNVREQLGKYLCPDCQVVVSFDSREFEGFEIQKRLGSGSNGMVYQARQLLLDRTVALKILIKHDGLSPRVESRFLREATTISRLSHPNIVKVYDACSFSRGYFIVMECFEGNDLQAMIEDFGVPSLAIGVSVGLQILDALDYAASQKIVHRDVKPANILYRPQDGIAKLSDFGLAKQVGVSSGTRDGEGVGTPCYMPPEQVNNARNVDHRADIYALGASFYHMFSGRFPVMADNLQDFMKGILERDPPPIERYNPKLPPELCSLIRRAMKKKPDERFQTHREMHAALDEVRKLYRVPPPPRI
ncbi:MAG: protein kinase [Planctomycetes bacterium]|nr:protein kinase [Planctomycetota bacterium]